LAFQGLKKFIIFQKKMFFGEKIFKDKTQDLIGLPLAI
jgi:hypothetical protein